MAEKKDSYFSTTLEKGLKILSLFNQDRVSCSLAELSELSGINKTSTYRFVNTLVQLGYLRRDPETRQIKLGARAVIVGHGFLRGFDLLQMIRPIIDDAHEEYRTTIDTAILDGDTVAILYRREAGNTLTYRLPTVTRSLHCSALGKAILAFQPREEVEEFLSRTPLVKKTGHTITDPEVLLAQLELARQKGYVVNQEEYIPGLLAIGAPLISSHTGRVLGSICFDMNVIEITVAEMEERYAEVIMGLAARISEVMPLI